MENSDIRVLLLSPAPSLIKYGIKWGFEQVGSYVYLMDGEDSIYLLAQDQQLAVKKIEKCIIEHKINVIFTEGYAGIPFNQIKELSKKYGIKIHFWAIEDPVTPQIAEHVIKNKLADHIWTTTIEFIPKYKKMGVSADLLLFACNPDFHIATLPDKKFTNDISVIGTNYSNRFDKTKEFIIPFIKNDYNIKIYGLWWENPTAEVNIVKYRDKNVYWNDGNGGHVLPYELLPTVVNSSKIMIGMNCSDYSITQTSCRPYETLCSSYESVYLAYYTKAQDKIFGDYIVQAKDGKEMLEKADMILGWNEAKRRAMAQEARIFVIQNHTYKHRAEQIVEYIKGD
jgi:spore maturation protein CgeB